MAFIFGDSFAHYLAADITKKWTALTATASLETDPTVVLPPAPTVLRLTGSSNYLGKTLPSTYETFVAGTWWRCPSLTTTAGIIMAFMDGATEHVSVRMDTSLRLTFTRNATVLATSTNTFTAGAWYHIEVKCTIGDAADSPSGRYEVRVNGSATNWIPDSGTGQDTRNGGNKNVGVVRLYQRGSSAGTTDAHHFSHFYFLDNSGSVANDFLGPCRFAVLKPTGVGNANAWTPNYADNWRNVADDFADGDSTFNQSATAGQKDKFVMSDVVSGTVHAVQAVLYARQDAGAARTVRPITRISGTDYSGTSFAMAGSYLMYCDPMTLSPATSAQWTDTEVNGAEFGYELVS